MQSSLTALLTAETYIVMNEMRWLKLVQLRSKLEKE